MRFPLIDQQSVPSVRDDIVHSLRKRRDKRRKIFMDEYALPEGQRENLFGIETSQKATEYDLGIGGTGDLQQFDGTIPYDDFKQQYRVSYTHQEWVKGMKIERKLVDDDLYSIINKRPQQLALVTKRTQENTPRVSLITPLTPLCSSAEIAQALCSASPFLHRDHTDTKQFRYDCFKPPRLKLLVF